MIEEIIKLVEEGFDFPELKNPELVQLTDLLFSWLQKNPRKGWVAQAFEGAGDDLIIDVGFRPEGEPYCKSVLMHSIHQGMV
jgi:hypothetical protein